MNGLDTDTVDRANFICDELEGLVPACSSPYAASSGYSLFFLAASLGGDLCSDPLLRQLLEMPLVVLLEIMVEVLLEQDDAPS